MLTTHEPPDMSRIVVQDLTGTHGAYKTLLKKTLALSARRLAIKNFELSVAIVCDAHIRKLNKTYRGIDKPTDVLSFEQGSIHKNTFMLGDIAISAETTRRQAKENSRTLKYEFTLLAIHGLLHLIGYDHATVAQEKKMFSLQSTLVTEALSHA